jgi:hypothetical protein
MGKSGTQELRKKEIERIFYPRERTKAHPRLMVESLEGKELGGRSAELRRR